MPAPAGAGLGILLTTPQGILLDIRSLIFFEPLIDQLFVRVESRPSVPFFRRTRREIILFQVFAYRFFIDFYIPRDSRYRMTFS